MTGAVYPSFGIVFGRGINSFSDTDEHQRRHDGDRNALYFFIIALVSTLTIGVQNYMFGATSAQLSAKLRTYTFKAILRQDVEFFDKDEHSVSPTWRLSFRARSDAVFSLSADRSTDRELE